MNYMTTEEKQEYIRRTWDLKPQPVPPFIVRPRGKWFATKARLENPQADLEEQLEVLENNATVGDFTVPALYTGVGIGVIAAAFGCESVLDKVQDFWVKPIVKEDPRAVYQLKLPDVDRDGLYPLVWQRIEYFQRQSKLPLRACNIPSPLTVASQLWDYTTFLTALYENPREIHHTLELATQAIIDFVKAQEQRITNLFGLTHEDWYFPREYGIRVSDDVLAEISPKHYREFGVRYNNRISRAFGGILIHSCGNIGHNLDVLLEVEGLRGVECNVPQNDLALLKEKLAGRTVLSLRYWTMDWVGQDIPELGSYTRELIDFYGPNGLLLLMESKDLTEARELAAALRQGI